MMEDADMVPKVVVPGSDEEMAKLALSEVFLMALGPTEQRTKLAALSKVLEFTKAKPASKTDLRINNAEAWLEGVLADHQSTHGSKG